MSERTVDPGGVSEPVTDREAREALTVVLVEPRPEARRKVCRRIERLGMNVSSFADPHLAFLYVLGRLDEIDGVLVCDADGPLSSHLVARLELLSRPVTVATYSAHGGDRGLAVRLPRVWGLGSS